jgi:hypothetical protein
MIERLVRDEGVAGSHAAVVIGLRGDRVMRLGSGKRRAT